jgi:large subunit ribosomal protein L6
MSRIGKLPISIPAGVTVTLKDNVVTVKGPKGELTQFINPAINVEIEDGQVVLKENENELLDNVKQRHAFHGLYRALINNMVVGVSQGYKKELELVGVGYRASNNGNIIDFSLGYTHSIVMQLPAEIKVETKSERNKNPLIILESCDKQLLGLVCAKFALSVSRNLIRVRVLSLLAKKFAESLVSQPVLSNHYKIVLS